MTTRAAEREEPGTATGTAGADPRAPLAQPVGAIPSGEAPTEPALAAANVMAKADAENFTVASRLLPRAEREHLLAVYGFARFVDDVGDLAEGDRCAQLDWVEAELDRALAGEATHPVFRRLGATISAVGIGRQPFADLVAANRQDQVVSRYATYEELEAYCRLSADPVGHLVLAVFGRTDPLAVELSDRVCTGLQLVEHWQDVAEDFAAGRVYLPQEDLSRFGVDESVIASGAATPAFRRLMSFECGRAARLIRSGAPLVGLLSGRARLAVAGFVGGGLAQLAAVEAVGFDVLAHRPKAANGSVAAHSLGVLLGRFGGRR